MTILYNKENCCFKPLTGRRKHNIKRKVLRKKKKQECRTWIAGRLITFVSLDIFGREHRFLCQMRKCHKDFHCHRCVFCRIINKYRVCMTIGGEMCKKCMRKSDLTCYPHKLRILK